MHDIGRCFFLRELEEKFLKNGKIGIHILYDKATTDNMTMICVIYEHYDIRYPGTDFKFKNFK